MLNDTFGNLRLPVWDYYGLTSLHVIDLDGKILGISGPYEAVITTASMIYSM